MDQVLNSYKKETNSLFAIRQTPSPVKEENGTVRLMWKSQHVPYDGIPFINIGKKGFSKFFSFNISLEYLPSIFIRAIDEEVVRCSLLSSRCRHYMKYSCHDCV